MRRRKYIAAVGTVGASLLAGCAGSDDSDDTGDSTSTPTSGANNTDTTETETDSEKTPDEDEESEDGPLAVLDTYIEAAREQDFEALADAMHSRHPFNPDNLDESEMENVSFDFGRYQNYEREVVDESFTTDDIKQMPTVGRWFEQMDTTPAAVLDGEETVLAEVTYETTEDGNTAEQTERLVLVTEDGDWQVFVPYQEPVDVPEGEPVDDERYQIVEGVEFDAESERVRVTVSGAGDIEAEKLVVYSTSFEEESTAWSESSETLPAVNYLTSPFDPAGDEIVVAIRFEDREIVVHRESYPTAEHDGLAVLDSYIEAANSEDLDLLADAMHSQHPFNPKRLDESENVSFDFGTYQDFEREIVDESFSTDDIREMENAEFWFQNVDFTLNDAIEGEEAALAEIQYEVTENNTTVEQKDQLILLTDDGDWRVFLTYDERVVVPDDEPIDDEQYQVVDSVAFDVEKERARVNVSGVGDIEAEELVVYSTSLGEDTVFWAPESETLPSLTHVTSGFDPAGDELVVAIRFEEREIVVHRETYEPDAEN
ncbi:hypothetical protein [Halovenus salina]|uniref:Uncharacterized protein n=1 Tax=Halovenus salina TaxID=1510225 RepID=A0ABD5VXF9_9EURY|nr:hypothetical protein [Halovenus salina]